MFLFTVLMITRKIKISCVAHIYIAVGQHYSKVLFKHSSQSDLFEMSDLFSVQPQIPQRLFSYLAQGKSQSFQWATRPGTILAPQLLFLSFTKISPVFRTASQAHLRTSVFTSLPSHFLTSFRCLLQSLLSSVSIRESYPEQPV